MGGSRVEEEVRGTVVCWDMVFWVFVFFFRGLFFLWCWREGGREGKREVVEIVSITRRERERNS